MSKRPSTFGGDEERYGTPPIQYENTANTEDPPRVANAAQMARRKIAQMKKPGARGRSGSPAVAPQPGTNQTNAFFGQSQPQQQAQNPFVSGSFDFAFAQPQQENGNNPFHFGASASATAQQNGTNNIFGQTPSATPSFGSTFGGGLTQPQTNGFNPANSTATNTNSFGGFGTSQQNGITSGSTTTSTFGSFGKPQESNPNGTSSFKFGAAQQEEANKTSSAFAGFGATQQDKDKQSNTFTGFGTTTKDTDPSNQNTSGFGFGQVPQGNGEKAANALGNFGQTQPESNGKPSNPFLGFGQKPAESAEKASTPFALTSQQSQEKQIESNGKPNNPFLGFGQKPAETSEKANNTLAGAAQQTQENGNSSLFVQQNGAKEKSTEKDAAPSIFAGFGSTQPAIEKKSLEDQVSKPSIFNFGQSQTAAKSQEQAPGLTTNIFAQPAQMGGEPPKGLFGASLTPVGAPKAGGSIFDNLPKKDLSNGGKPLFSSSDSSQIYKGDEDDDDEADKVNGESASSSVNIFGLSQQKQDPKASGSLFNSSSQAQQSNTPMFKQTAPFPLSNNKTVQKDLFGKADPPFAPEASAAPAAPTQTRSLFDRVDKADMEKRLGRPVSSEKAAETPKISFGNNGEAQAQLKPLFSAPTAAQSTFPQPPESQTPISSPPKSLFQKPASQTSTSTMSTTALQSTSARARMADHAPSPSGSANIPPGQRHMLKILNDAFLLHLKFENPEQDWSEAIQYYLTAAAKIRGTSAARVPVGSGGLNVPHPTASTNILAQTPKQPAATGLFAQPPSTAPPAAQKRPSAVDSELQAPATEKRSKNNEAVSYPKLPENASSTAKLFEFALDKSQSAKLPQSAAASSFNPSTKSMFGASTSQTLSAGASDSPSKPAFGGPPVFSASSAGGTNFLSAFGSRAKKQDDEDRKKRKAEDFDSDDESEEAWEKRDQEEQEAKRAKIAEAAKSAKGFMISSTHETPKAPAFKFAAPGGNSFATPAASTPTLNGLFASTATTPSASSTGEIGKFAPPAGLNVGSKSTSAEVLRATSPGVTTDGETSVGADSNNGGELSDEPNMSQIDDQTALQPAEREANEIILEIPKAQTKKLTKKEGQDKASWESKGDGRVYVLKDKKTGKSRILCRVGMGHIVLNFQPLKGMKYELHAKKDTMVICPFMDHINHSPPKPDRFYITTATSAEAKDLARVLTEGVSE